MDRFQADFSQVVGCVKPLHGINNTPVVYRGRLPELQDAGIPYVRLHDTGGPFGGTHLVDVPNVFPDFEADPLDERSYDFAYTDAYFQTLAASGLKPFYRLGVTIENHYYLRPYRVRPPRDFQRWADICCQIIRHYNEGWANGFHYGIEYWEIWNEPESEAMWQGTPEEYFELYATAARTIRRRFPRLKVGGYAGCGFFAVTRPDCSAQRRGYLDFFHKFLEFMKNATEEIPLDFFSWHLYTQDPHETAAHAHYGKEGLTAAGLVKTESILDEWNYIEHDTCDIDQEPWDAMREMAGAAFVAATFALLQKAPVDKAMYYDALPSRKYGGLYLYPENKVSRTYYVFKAFNELYLMGQAVHCASGEGRNGVYCLAARDGHGNARMLIANRSHQSKTLAADIRGAEGAPKVLVLDADRVLTEVDWLWEERQGQPCLTLPPESVLLLRWNGVPQAV